MASENDFTSCDGPGLQSSDGGGSMLSGELMSVPFLSLPQTRSVIKGAACLCTVKPASPALPPSVSPTSCGPTAWSWTRPSSSSSSAAASSPPTSASWGSSSSSSPRSWPRPRAPRRQAARPSATAARSSISRSPSPCTLQPISFPSYTVPSPRLPAAEDFVRSKDPELELRDSGLSVAVILISPDGTTTAFQREILYLSPGSILCSIMQMWQSSRAAGDFASGWKCSFSFIGRQKYLNIVYSRTLFFIFKATALDNHNHFGVNTGEGPSWCPWNVALSSQLTVFAFWGAKQSKEITQYGVC